MHILLWILQILLSIHTVTGAVWKFSNSEQTVPSLTSIPHEIWLALAVIELLCSVGLILPAFKRSLAVLAPVAALCIAAEMLFYCGVHIFSGVNDNNPMIYWLVVAAVCVFIAYGRFKLKPIPVKNK